MKNRHILFQSLLLISILSACSSAPKAGDSKDAAPPTAPAVVIPTEAKIHDAQTTQPSQASPSAGQATPAQPTTDELRALMQNLNNRIDALETKLSSFADKLDSTKGQVEKTMAVQALNPATSPIAAKKGQNPPIGKAAGDPEIGFTTDQAIAGFRRGMILFEGQKFPEAVLEFSAFLDQFADHALAGSAQFYVGESYFRQKEYKLAMQEFQRVLTSYDRSSVIPQTLKQMVRSAEILKQDKEATQLRQTLLSLFPQSPAAFDLESAPKSTVASGPAETVKVPPVAPPTAPVAPAAHTPEGDKKH